MNHTITRHGKTVEVPSLIHGNIQNVFNYIVDFMMNQNSVSRNDVINVFRGSNETCCAVGCVIDDEMAIMCDKYGKGTSSLFDILEDHNEHTFHQYEIEVLCALQRCHDNFREGIETQSFSDCFISRVKSDSFLYPYWENYQRAKNLGAN